MIIATETTHQGIKIGKHERGKGYPVRVDGVLAGHVWKWADRHWSHGDIHDRRSQYCSHPTRNAAAQHLAETKGQG